MSSCPAACVHRASIRRVAPAAVVALTVWAAIAGCAGRESAAVKGRARLTVWAHHGQPAEREALAGIVAAFNAAHPDGPAVAISFFPDRQYADKVSIASATGRLPDVVEVDGPYVGPWAAEGLLKPLDGFVDDALRADFLPTIIAQGTFQDCLYALGAFDSALVVYYNRDIIARAGLAPPEHVADAWDWATFRAALEKAKPYVAVPLALHVDEPGDEWMTYAFAPLIWSNGGALIDVQHGRTIGVLDGPQAVAAITKWQRLITDGLAEASSVNPNLFAAGDAAFDWSGHWMLPAFEQTAGLDFGAMPLPRTGDRSVTSAGSWCWGISRDCRDPAAAWRFIAWLLDPERGIKPIVEANGAVPARRSAFALFPEYDSGVRRLFREQLETSARARPRTAVYLALTTSFARALRDIALGADVAAALHQAAESVQHDLDRRRARREAGR
ncbi:MAG TPA: sugar ABC transporter substrate-binding protein [Phycisphaerae bacterium]|nr:sugar ABC transporter substrate-binding protein [Phycisphaerales bacterium]HRX87498.1 sugar ABC transporter substrate-binding protein [Phycisphaerae bacterium]